MKHNDIVTCINDQPESSLGTRCVEQGVRYRVLDTRMAGFTPVRAGEEPDEILVKASRGVFAGLPMWVWAWRFEVAEKQ